MNLQTVELIMAVEAAFMIEIPDSKSELVVSLGQLGKIVETELGRLNRPKNPAKVLDQITYIAAHFGGLERTELSSQTTLIEVLAKNKETRNRSGVRRDTRSAAKDG